MKKKTALIHAMALVVMTTISATTLAADLAAGKSKAASCTVCHGSAGISNNNLWPNLAGQKAGYLAKQIKAFRDGSRADPMMAPMVKALSDDDIENISAYFSSLK